MKRIFAVVLLLLSLASAALADGSGGIPPASGTTKSPQRSIVA